MRSYHSEMVRAYIFIIADRFKYSSINDVIVEVCRQDIQSCISPCRTRQDMFDLRVFACGFLVTSPVVVTTQNNIRVVILIFLDT